MSVLVSWIPLRIPCLWYSSVVETKQVLSKKGLENLATFSLLNNEKWDILLLQIGHLPLSLDLKYSCPLFSVAWDSASWSGISNTFSSSVGILCNHCVITSSLSSACRGSCCGVDGTLTSLFLFL